MRMSYLYSTSHKRSYTFWYARFASALNMLKALYLSPYIQQKCKRNGRSKAEYFTLHSLLSLANPVTKFLLSENKSEMFADVCLLCIIPNNVFSSDFHCLVQICVSRLHPLRKRPVHLSSFVNFDVSGHNSYIAY